MILQELLAMAEEKKTKSVRTADFNKVAHKIFFEGRQKFGMLFGGYRAQQFNNDKRGYGLDNKYKRLSVDVIIDSEAQGADKKTIAEAVEWYLNEIMKPIAGWYPVSVGFLRNKLQDMRTNRPSKLTKENFKKMAQDVADYATKNDVCYLGAMYEHEVDLDRKKAWEKAQDEEDAHIRRKLEKGESLF